MGSKGIRYMIIASFFFAIMNVLVKYIDQIPPVEIVFFRSFVSFFMSLIILKSKNIPVFGNDKRWLALRGIAGAIGLITFFYTLQKMPLANAVTVQYLSPIFTAILGIWIVKEKVWSLQWAFFALAFIGVLVIQGFNTDTNWVYILLGVTSAVFSGLAYNCVRKMKNTEHPLVIVFYFPLITLPITAIWSYFLWVMPHGIEWVILLLIGIFTQLAQFYLTKAYQSDDLSKIASLKYLGVVYAFLFGYFIFDETYTLQSFIGVAILLLGVGANILYKNKKESEAN